MALVVPPANPAVEPEMRRLLPQDLLYHTTRLPVFPDTTLYQRNDLYLKSYADTLKTFGSLGFDACSIAMTGSSYKLLPSGDEEMCRDLSQQFQAPVVTASLAILMLLRAIGAKKISLVSPYPKELTQKAIDYWTAAGLEVVQTHAISGEFRAYELTGNEIVDAIGAVDTSDAAEADAILLTGTGANTLDVLLEIQTRSSRPILSSNLCSAAALWSLTGLNAPAEMTRALPALFDGSGEPAAKLKSEMLDLLHLPNVKNFHSIEAK
ncbi:hypothetical protein [Pararhodobacter oceanensis]|uniref:maleate cis-trans isomerase family protein n=1 Tax=Pararhodobacter oceanensis TaxID=2172121 RepID=UPI003A945D0E